VVQLSMAITKMSRLRHLDLWCVFGRLAGTSTHLID
jgi:hypothetical protein